MVHLFGATSSPSCASYALRKTAEDRKYVASQKAVETVLYNFYVDDCLRSVCMEKEAIDLVKGLRETSKTTSMFFMKEQNNVQNSELLNPALKFECLDVNANHSF